MSSAEGDDPPFLPVGTEVSAKYRGAFCEAKISKVVRSVKYKVVGKSGTGATFVPEDRIRGNIRLGGFVEVKNDKSQYVECSIVKIKDLSQYTVVFNDGDIATLRRTALCLKSGRHFAESETLDQLPLTHPEHFSTPVISSSSTSNASNRRGRRNRLDDDSGDEELVTSKSKQSKSKAEKEADIGKVVCVELSDNRKKLSRDNWFPGLIVSPTAQNSAVKIQIKNEYLIRSFKDGRYYTVPKKETQEFTRDIANRVENSSLKTAVEKALLFLDKDELPPHWDRELLFGLGESGSSDSDNGFDSDSSDDEPREEKDHFVAQLYKFMDDRGTPINKGPQINFKDIDLYKLFKVVHKLGGCNRVTNHNQWKLVSLKLGYSQTGFTPNLVKFAYKKYLHSFEDFYRKLGCTMLSNPRSNRSRSRSGRSLIRDKDRLTPVQRDKSSEDKDSRYDSSSDRKDEDSDEKDRDSDTKSVKDAQSSVVKSSVKVKDEKPDAKAKEEKSKSELETKVADEDSRKEEKKIRTVKSSVENVPKTSEKSEIEVKVSKKDVSKTNKDEKDLPEVKDSKSVVKTDRDNRMSKKLSALEETKDKKPKSILGKVLMKRKNPKNAEKGAVKDHLSTLQNTRRKRSLKEKVKEIAKKFKLKKSGHQDVAKVIEEEIDIPPSVVQSQKTSDSEASGKQSTRSKLKDDVASATKSRKQSVQSVSPPVTVSVPEPLPEKKPCSSSSAVLSNSEPASSTTNSAPTKSKKTEDDSNDASPSSSQGGPPSVEAARKKLGKKKKDEETKTGPSSTKEDSKTLPFLKPVSIGDKLKVYYGPPTQDSKKVTYEAKVLNMKDNRNSTGEDSAKLYLVHYTGWNTRYDEWIPLSRIADNLTGHSEGSENSGTDTAQPKSSNDSKSSPAGSSKSGSKSGFPPRNKSPGNSVRPPSSRLLAKKSRTRKISSQNTDGSDSEIEFPEMEDSATRTDESDDDNDFHNTSELSASSLTNSEINTRSRREKQRKVPDLGKDSDNSNDSKKKDEMPQSRLNKKPGMMKRKNSDLSMKTTKSVKEDDEENEEADDWQTESRKKIKSKLDEEDSSGSAKKKKGPPVKEASKDSDEMDISADNSSTLKKKITRSNKDLSFDDSSFTEVTPEKTTASGKKITTRSTVIKRSPRCKSSLYSDDVDEDADGEDNADDNEEPSVVPKKMEPSVSSAVFDKKTPAEKDKEYTSKKILKTKPPITSPVVDLKEDSVDKKKSLKSEEERTKKEPSLPSLTENIYQRRYSGRRSTHLKNKQTRNETEEKLDAKVSPKGREYDLAAIRSELKGLSKPSQGLNSDELLNVASDIKMEEVNVDAKPIMGSSFEDDNDQSLETVTDSSPIEVEVKANSSSGEPLSAQKKSTASAESVPKKPALSLESAQKSTTLSSDSTSKKQILPEPTVKKAGPESVLKPVSTPEPTSKKTVLPEFPLKKTVAAESVSKKISSAELVPKKSVSPTESSLKKSVTAQETTPKKSGPESSKKKPGLTDSSSKRADPATPNRFAVIEQSSSDVDDIYEFKDSDPFEFMECRSKSGSSDEKNSSKLTPRRPVGPSSSAISSSPAKVDSLESRNTLSVSSATPKKKPFSDSLSSPPPLVSFSSEVPSVVSVTTSMKRKLNEDSNTGSAQDGIFKKKVPPIVSSASSSAAPSFEKSSTETSKIEAVKSFLFDVPQSQSTEKAKSDAAKLGTDPIKVEPIDVKPVVSLVESLMETSSLSILSDSASKKDKHFISAPVVCPVIKSDPDKLESKRPLSDEKIDSPEPKASIENERLQAAYDAATIRKNQKTFGKQPVYSRDSKYPPPLVPSKSSFPVITEDKIIDIKTQISPVLDSKISALDNARTKLSPNMFSGPANSKSADVSVTEPIDVKPNIVPDQTLSKLPEKTSIELNKDSVDRILAEAKPVEVVTSIIEKLTEKPVSAAYKESASITREVVKSKYEESEAKTKDPHLPVTRKDYSSKQRKPVISKEFINEDSSSSDCSSNDFNILSKQPLKTTPTSSGRNFQSIFNSSSSDVDDDDDDDDNNNDDNDDDEDDDEGNLQICVEVSSQEDIKKAIIGEDNIDDDNDADDDDDGDDDDEDDDDDDIDDDDDDDDEDDDDDDDDNDDDSRDHFISRKDKKAVSAKKQGMLNKVKMDSTKDLREAKHILSTETDSADEKKISIKEEKTIKKEDDFELKISEASDENDFIDNELLCEEIIPKSPPPSGSHVDSGTVKLPSNKSSSKSKEMPFASALSSNCSYSGSDKIYSNSKNLSMFPPKTIKTLQPSSSKFRSSSSTNNDRKEISSASESNDSSKVLLMDITPPMTPENCLSPVSNSPTDDQSNSSPAHVQDDTYKSSSMGLKTVDYNDDSSSTLDIKSGSSKKSLDSSSVGSSRKRRRSETEGSSSKGQYSSYDSSRKKVRSNQQSPRAAGSESDDGSEQGASTLGSSPSNSSITKPSKNNFFVELDPELDGTQRIAILQQKLQDLRKTYMNLKQELACIDRRRKKICRREREGYAYGLRSMNALVRNQD